MEVLPQSGNIQANICENVCDHLINRIHDHVEQYLDSINRSLSAEEQYAHILYAYDDLIKECKKEYSQDNVDTIIIVRHLGDELVSALKELGISEEVKIIYTNL